MVIPILFTPKYTPGADVLRVGSLSEQTEWLQGNQSLDNGVSIYITNFNQWCNLTL